MLNFSARIFFAPISVVSLLTAWCPECSAQPPVEVQAVAGEPFGVGAVTLNLSPDMLPQPLGIEGVGVSEKSNRVFYPAMRTPAVANALRDFLAEENPLTTGGPVREEVGGILRGVLNRPPRTTIYFLFRGAEPLNLVIDARTSISLIVPTRNAPALHRRLMETWWRDYAAPRRLLAQKPDYPPQVKRLISSTVSPGG
jgi:hypothetical protein